MFLSYSLKTKALIMTQNSKKPWERLPEESSKQFEAFCIYRDLGPGRSIQKVAQNRSGSGGVSKLKEWSSKYDWVERAEGYDQYLEKIIRETNEDAIQEMVKRHAEDSKEIQLAIKEQKNDPQLDEMSPKEKAYFFDALSRSYKTMASLERLSRGVPTENIKQENEVTEVNKDVITPEKLKKPEVRKAADKFIKAIADSQSSTNGVSTDSK